MKLQDLDLNENQVKAFFLGAKCAQKPLSFDKAVEDLLSENPEARQALTPELSKIWESDLFGTMFPANKDLFLYLETAKEQIDYFLTALSLAGTNAESLDDEDFIEFIEEFEELVADLDEYLDDENASNEDGEEFKDFLQGMWAEFVETKR